MNANDELRPFAMLVPDMKAWAAENGCADEAERFNYRGFLDAALNGRIPAERVNSRWHYRRSNRARIAAGIGVVPKAAAPAAAA